MNELPRKFTIERKAEEPRTLLEQSITDLYTKARNHENVEVFDALYWDVALFADTLRVTYTPEELSAVPAYHALIRSGIPTNLHEQKDAEKNLVAERKEAIEDAIKEFVEIQLQKITSVD